MSVLSVFLGTFIYRGQLDLWLTEQQMRQEWKLMDFVHWPRYYRSVCDEDVSFLLSLSLFSSSISSPTFWSVSFLCYYIYFSWNYIYICLLFWVLFCSALFYSFRLCVCVSFYYGKNRCYENQETTSEPLLESRISAREITIESIFFTMVQKFFLVQAKKHQSCSLSSLGPISDVVRKRLIDLNWHYSSSKLDLFEHDVNWWNQGPYSWHG